MVGQKIAQSSLRHNWLNRSETQSARHDDAGINRSARDEETLHLSSGATNIKKMTSAPVPEGFGLKKKKSGFGDERH